MARENPRIWGCDYHPIKVVRVRSGRRARCLGCGTCGPVKVSGEEAMLVLRYEARYRDRVGA